MEEPVSRYQVGDGSALVENEDDGGEDRQRAVDEDEDGKLRKVGEEEHGRDHTNGE